MKLNKPTSSELSVALLKGGLGAIPILGSLVAEVVGTLIPNQRLHRLEELVAELARQLGEQSQSQSIQARFKSPEFVDLLEEGMTQAARAVSPERLVRIAALLKNSLTGVELRHLQDKRVLEILGQINDAEVILLQSYTRKNRFDKEFQERHKSILHPPAAHMNAAPEVVDQAAVHKQFLSHLISLGLLERPDSSYQVTDLGRLLLRRIDVLGAEER